MAPGRPDERFSSPIAAGVSLACGWCMFSVNMKPESPLRSVTYIILCLLAAFQLGGCSTLSPPQQRRAVLSRLLASDTPQILLYRPHLSVRSPEVLFGGVDRGPELSATAGMEDPLRQVAAEFAADAMLPAATEILEVNAQTRERLLALDPTAPVLLFFSGGWYLDYQRIPLKLHDYKLSFSIFGKVISRGAVLSGKGSLALPGQIWEASCYHVGNRHAYTAWRADGAALFRKEMTEGLDSCRQKLAADFVHALREAGL